MRILEDVNLDKIVVRNDGKAVSLEFIDMYKGAPIGVIQCTEVIVLNYHNVMDSEGFAIYVGEVELKEFSDDSAREKLSEMGFGFRDASGKIHVQAGNKICHLHVEGGEVCIDICCGKCEFEKYG